MDNVVYMPIKPKSVTGSIGHHTYILCYNPNTDDDTKRWSWCVKYTRVYEYYGSAATEAKAKSAAEKKIRTEMDYQRTSGI